MKWIDKISITTLLILALLLGLAPFVPEPHVWEKLKMLVNGDLQKPLDIFDLFMHGTPWLLLFVKALRMVTANNTTGE